jgi:hypothetical protein
LVSDIGEEHRLRGFEYRLLRKIFGPEREEDGSLRKFHHDEVHNLNLSSNIIRVIKSRRVRWVLHVAHGGEESCLQVLVGRSERKRPLEGLGVGERTKWEWTLGR